MKPSNTKPTKWSKSQDRGPGAITADDTDLLGRAEQAMAAGHTLVVVDAKTLYEFIKRFNNED